MAVENKLVQQLDFVGKRGCPKEVRLLKASRQQSKRMILKM
jgi:hypothetical protein